MQRNQPLSKYSTFGIGGDAKYFTEVKTLQELQRALSFCKENKLKFHILGKGSNSLFDDRGFDGVVILNKISFCEINGEIVSVGAGYNFSLLGNQTARKGLCGLEFASGIPATVGGAIYMNAGANGKETCENLIEVTFVDADGEIQIFPKEKLVFSYRTSCFQKMQGAIVSAKFHLGLSSLAREVQKQIIEYRTKTQPYGELSCGCIFQNPEGISAGALIEKCGLKGMRVGDAEVSHLHANFIVNKGKAKASDVKKLAELIQAKVREKTGIDLHLELRSISYD